MAEEKISYLYVSLAALLWASTASVGKILLRDLDNFQVLFYTSIFATMTLFIVALFQKKLYILKTYKISDYWNFTWMGFIGVFLYYQFFFGGLMFAPAQEVNIVNYTWPIWVVIFALIILKEEFNLKKLLALGLGFIGVYMVVTKGDILGFTITNTKGNILALLSGVAYGIFSALGKKMNYDKVVSLMLYFATSAILMMLVTPIFSEIPSISLNQLLGLLWLGAIASGFASVFWFLALKHGETAKMSNIIFLTPFLSLLYIHFLVGEQILISSVFGLIIIVAGIIIQSNNKNKASTSI